MAQHTGGKRWWLAAAAGVVVAGAVARFGSRHGGPVLRRVTRRQPEPEPVAATMWSCVCGERLRTVGSGRHQVHWLADAPEDEPLLDGACPACGRTLSLAA
ncbi:MAG TPA: hypothetical protein VGO71_07025 [Baekduia sp.]|jgi:hypothetical protein|nr:hypothetical protein [Baekduia sp.]